MLISMEERHFQLSVRLSLLNSLCQAMQKALESRKVQVLASTQQRLTVRAKGARLQRQGKLALLDVSAARKR